MACLADFLLLSGPVAWSSGSHLPPAAEWLLAYLVNALWQLPLLAAAAALAAWAARRLGAGWVHRVWAMALAAGALLPACGSLDPALTRAVSAAAAGEGSVHTAMGPASAGAGSVLILASWLAWTLLGCWLAWTAAAAVRLAAGLAAVRRLRARAVPLSGEQRALLPAGLARVAARTAAGLGGPVVIGALKPLLLLPEEFFSHAAQDARAALAHEQAHIERRDYGKNLLLTLLTLPLAWHPCTWLLRARVSESREMACDAIAAGVTPGGVEYARALLRLARLYPQAAHGTPWPAAGMFDGRSLERRMTTMMHPPKQLRGLARVAVLGALTLFAAGAGMATASARMDVAAGASPKPLKIAVSSGVMEGNILAKPAPVYPPAAKAAHQQGTVVLAATINTQGAVQQLHVIKSAGKLLDQSALAAVHQWRYKPYLLNGEPVAVQTTINVTYSLADPKAGTLPPPPQPPQL